MKFVETTRCAVISCQPVIWVRTHENIEALNELIGMSVELPGLFRIFRWDCVNGMAVIESDDPSLEFKKVQMENKAPNMLMAAASSNTTLLAAMQRFLKQCQEKEDDYANVLIVDNFHHHCNDPQVIQMVQLFTAAKKDRNASIILIAHYDQQVPVDLRSYATVVDHDLPELPQLTSMFESLLVKVQNPKARGFFDNFDSSTLEFIAEAGLGLSRLQFESEASFALAATVSNIDEIADAQQVAIRVKSVIQERKAALFNSEGLVRIKHSAEKVTEIGGLEGLKSLVSQRFARLTTRYRRDRNPRGYILLGPPGTGKSTTCRALANMLGLLMVEVDVGSLKSGIVGASEGRIRRMFQIIRAMRRIMVFIDEIEKVFPSGNELDSGVSADQLSVWLTELSDPNRMYYMIASANQCHKLPAPLLRAGRFDGIVMVDIPKKVQQKKIWEIARAKFGISDTALPDYTDWTGAEIEACCDAADSLGVSLKQAAKTIIPIAKLAPEEIDKVREYAKNRAIDAETGEIYTGEDDASAIPVTGSRRASIGEVRQSAKADLN